MRHLTDAEIVDAAEALDLAPEPAPPDRDTARHLATCASCQASVTRLREALLDAAQDRPVEPSPLFWDHFAARVASAIREEPAATPRAWPWRGRPAAVWLVLLLVVLGAATFSWRATLHAPRGGEQATVPSAAEPARPTPDGEPDAAWVAVGLAADRLTGEDAQALALGAAPGLAEEVAIELSADERDELTRLLETELKRTGV